MNILFLSRWLPYPPENGSKIRIFNLLRQLSSQHVLSLLAFQDHPYDATEHAAVEALGRFCHSIRIIPYRPFRPASVRAWSGFLSPWPRSLVDTYSPRMAQAVNETVNRARYDLVIASQLDMIPYTASIRGIPLLFEEVELSTYWDAVHRSDRPIHRARALLTWIKLCRYLRATLPAASACTVVSARERALVQRAVPGYGSVEVIPNAVDLHDLSGDFGPPVPDTLVFTGALTYFPNYDAMRYFLERIYPHILAVTPGLRLRITGRTDGVTLTPLARQAGVEFTGHLADVRPLVARSWISVVPIRLGGGTRLKILESLGLGTPVISTSKGAEGLEVTDGQEILLADTTELFAQRIVELLHSPDRRQALSAAGRRLIAEKYDWQVIGQRLNDLVRDIASRRACR
ncbi:MAG: glycosyltransferase [Chloroflexi bacterium]|nr:glycosyltransferase [Chloroflexota bacterium]